MTLKIKAPVSESSIPYNLLMCCDDDDDDGDCWLPVITPPPAHMSLLSQQMMGHLCLTGANRHRWTFSDPSSNYTLRTRRQPIKTAPPGTRAVHLWMSCLVTSQICGCCCLAGMTPPPLNLRKHTRRPRGKLKPLGFSGVFVTSCPQVGGGGVVCRANVDEVFLVVFPQANCPGY